MPLMYGDHNQFTVGAPECGAFVQYPALYYVSFYYMPIMIFVAISINAFVIYLLLASKTTLMNQSQHVYVLGSAITNLCVAVGCNILAWIATLLLPCIYIGVVPCFLYDLVNYAGGYQLMTNVCLVCYDRWRLVRLGATYQHVKEVKRAKWLLCATAMLNLAIFLVPEIGVPLLTGVWYDQESPRCSASQEQTIGQSNIAVSHFLGYFMIVVPWVIITGFTIATTLELRATYKKSANTIGHSQVADARKMLRATFIMFGMIVVLLVTFGPLAVGLLLLDVAPSYMSFRVLQSLLYLQFSTPAFEPFVFAITLPKLRKSARETYIGRKLMAVKRLMSNKVTTTTGEKTTKVVSMKKATT